MEALRRLRRNSSDTNVDRRLVNNVLLSFLSTPRADAKRFEMLTLLASVLSWTDAEREKAGLQRSSITASSGNSFWGRPSNIGSPSQKAVDLEKTDETEVIPRTLLLQLQVHRFSVLVFFPTLGRIFAHRSKSGRNAHKTLERLGPKQSFALTKFSLLTNGAKGNATPCVIHWRRRRGKLTKLGVATVPEG